MDDSKDEAFQAVSEGHDPGEPMKADDRVVMSTANAGSGPWWLSSAFPKAYELWLGCDALKHDPELAYFHVEHGHKKRVTKSEARALSAWNGGGA